jgi:hypothetical protein
MSQAHDRAASGHDFEKASGAKEVLDFEIISQKVFVNITVSMYFQSLGESTNCYAAYASRKKEGHEIFYNTLSLCLPSDVCITG